MTELHELVPEADTHYWHPVPAPEARRHAFRGSRRWPGQTSGQTVCGVEVAMARPGEMNWIYLPTCGFCWEELVSQQRSREVDGQATSGRPDSPAASTSSTETTARDAVGYR